MIKYIQYDYTDRNGHDIITPIHNDFMMSKFASECGGKINPELDAYLRELGSTPSNVMRIVVRAVSAMDGWDDNVNGDSFTEEDLIRPMKYVDLGNRNIKVLHPHEHAGSVGEVYEIPMYRTFDIFGNYFKEHINGIKSPTYGKVLRAFYNPIQKRVEIVIDVDRETGDDIVRSYEKGEKRKVSMGFKCVPGDVCSICGNLAPTTKQYCDHLKHDLGKVMPDGRLVTAINDKGFFFDISDVENPADKTALYLFKVATGKYEKSQSSAEIAEKMNKENSPVETEDRTSFLVEGESPNLKEADIDKIIDVDIEIEKVANGDTNSIYAASKILFDRPSFSKEKIASIYKDAGDFNSAISTMYAAGIIPTKQDFQDLALMKMGQEELIDYYRDRNMLFETKVATDRQIDRNLVIDFDNVNTDLLEKFANDDSLMTERSFHGKWQAKRMAHYLQKVSSIKKAEGGVPLIDQIDDVLIPNPEKYRYVDKVVVQHQDNPHKPQINPTDTTVKEFNPFTPLALIGGMYWGMRALRNTQEGAFMKLLNKNKYTKSLLPLMVGASYAGSKAIQNAGVPSSPGALPNPSADKQASFKQKAMEMYPKARELATDSFLNLLGATALGWGMGGRAENKRLAGVQPNSVEEFYEQHPILGTLGTFATMRGAGRMLPKQIKLSNIANAIILDDANIDDFDRDTLETFIYKGAQLLLDEV